MTDQLNVPRSIRTISGKYVNVFDPDPDTIDITDIAHGLSFICRFGGQMKSFYSVAQHSFLVASMVDPEQRLAALMHDATEAYLMDIPAPFKKELPDYLTLEDSLMRVMAEKYEFQYPFHQQVKDADKDMLEIEWDNLIIMKGSLPSFFVYPPFLSRQMFLDAFYELRKQEILTPKPSREWIRETIPTVKVGLR